MKADPNSFENMTKNVKKPSYKDPYKISDNKVVAWFQRYWYYYKAPVIICAVVLLLVGIFIFDMVTKKEADMYFTIITHDAVSEEQMYELATHITDYVSDANMDGYVRMSPQSIVLVEEPKDDSEMASYYQIMMMFSDKNHTAFIVDDYVYDYMMDSDALEKLSTFGIESEEEYRIKLNGTEFMEETSLNDGGPYYLVFKVRNEDSKDEFIIDNKYDMFIKLAKDIIGAESKDSSAIESNSDKLKSIAKDAVNAE